VTLGPPWRSSKHKTSGRFGVASNDSHETELQSGGTKLREMAIWRYATVQLARGITRRYTAKWSGPRLMAAVAGFFGDARLFS